MLTPPPSPREEADAACIWGARVNAGGLCSSRQFGLCGGSLCGVHGAALDALLALAAAA
jgi:hypothetical protein